LVLTLAATTAFVVVALVVAIWPLIGGTNPAGANPDLALVTLSVRNTDGQIGVRPSALESLKGVSGVRSVHYGRSTMAHVVDQDRQIDAVTTYVNSDYFRSLGVGLQGPGFSAFTPWQANLLSECVVGSSLARDLGRKPVMALLGQELDVNGQPCRVVGIADEKFAGLRPPRRTVLWRSWRSQTGSGFDVVPHEALEDVYRAREVGLVRDPAMSLDALEAAVTAVLRQPGAEVRDLRLLPGDGVEPGPRHRMLKEVRLILLAVGVLLAVTLIFATTYALWHSESVRGSQGVRLALGATASHLLRQAAKHTLIQMLLSMVVGAVVARVIWMTLTARTELGTDYLQLAASMPWQGVLFGAVTVIVLGTCTWLLEVRAWLRPARTELVWTIRRFAATSPIENTVGALIIAATLSGTLLAAWILDDFGRLRDTPRGYSNSDVTTLAFSPSKEPIGTLPVHTRSGHAIDSVMHTLGQTPDDSRVALSQSAPHKLAVYTRGITRYAPDGARTSVQMTFNRVSQNFFRVYGIEFLEGGEFSSNTDQELILSASAARNLLGSPPWIGREVSLDMDEMTGTTRRLAGVVQDVAWQGRNSPMIDLFYMPLQDMGDAQVISIAEPVPAALADIPAVLARIDITDALDPPVRIRDKDAEDDRIGGLRAMTLLATCVLAVVLGALGLGEILLVVANRRLHELALRSALGATLGSLAWSAFRKQIPALLLGVSIGFGVFVLAANNLVTRGFSVTPPSPETMWQAAAVLFVLLVLVLIPSLLKLRRIPVALLLKQD